MSEKCLRKLREKRLTNAEQIIKKQNIYTLKFLPGDAFSLEGRLELQPDRHNFQCLKKTKVYIQTHVALEYHVYSNKKQIVRQSPKCF